MVTDICIFKEEDKNTFNKSVLEHFAKVKVVFVENERFNNLFPSCKNFLHFTKNVTPFYFCTNVEIIEHNS